MKLYELVNPSDGYTFYASSPEVAALAAWTLSGMYAAKCLDGKDEADYGFARFGAQDLTAKVGDLAAFLVDKGHEVADALASFVVGTWTRADREKFEAEIGAVPPEEAAKWRAAWDDKRRSSMSNIGAAARQLAATFRGKAKKAVS